MTESRKKAAEALLSLKQGIITFKSYLEKDTMKAHTYVPKKDKRTNWFFGVPRVTKEMKESGLPYVNPENPFENEISHFTVKNNTTLDLSIESNKKILEWLVYCDGLGGIALTREEGISNETFDFYIYDEILELNRKTKEFDEKLRAMNTLKETSDALLGNYTRLLGERFEYKNPAYIRMWLQDLIDGKVPGRNYKDFLAVVDDKNKDYKLMIKKLLDKNLITIDKKTKEVRYGNISLAVSEEGFITWMQTAAKDKNSPNYDIYIEIKEKLAQ